MQEEKERDATTGSGRREAGGSGLSSRGRGALKFLFWTALSGALFALAAHWHSSGRLSAWYYHTASEDGYAVNADSFADATKESPVLLEVGSWDAIDGAQAVPVKKGDRLPANANGTISLEVLEDGGRASLERGKILVTVPWKIEEAKGFKFKNSFKHKGVKTWPWAALINVLLVIGLGVCLGYMAEGFTDFLGMKIEKIKHFEGGH